METTTRRRAMVDRIEAARAKFEQDKEAAHENYLSTLARATTRDERLAAGREHQRALDAAVARFIQNGV